jgi:hypothetical protein
MRRTAEIVLGASFAVVTLLFLVLGAVSGFANGSWSAWFVYYGHTLAGSFGQFLSSGAIFSCLALILLVIWSLGGSFLKLIFPKLIRRKSLNDPYHSFINGIKRSRELWLILGAILFITMAGLVMGEASRFALPRLKDIDVISLEPFMFGNYVFAALGAIHYPHWLIEFIIISFDNMGLILVAVGVFTFYLAPRIFRELIIAFCIGILAMIPLWLVVPALSPQDRFIDNMYGLHEPNQIALAVARYNPQPEIQQFLLDVREEKTNLLALPTSTMPSAHVFWAVLAGYYIFRVKRPWKIIGWIALPFLAASTLGTILLAQHYFLDIPAGIAIAALAIWFAHNAEAEEIVKVV